MFRKTMIVLMFLGAAVAGRATVAAELSAEQLKQVAKKPHSPKLTVPQLRIYPAIRKYHVRVTRYVPGREPASIELDVAEKWVDGKFIVSSFRLPGADEMTHMIVTYDGDDHCYRKWIVSADKVGEVMIGTRVGSQRTLSWATPPPQEGAKEKLFVVSQETHTNTSTEWSEIHLEGSKVVARVKGKAVASE